LVGAGTVCDAATARQAIAAGAQFLVAPNFDAAVAVVAEGAGAAGIAALLAFPERFSGRRVGVPICGANIDARILANVLLRNLLRDDFEVRAFYQGLFDHLLVDELQDTDPLQAEILLYLAEGKPAAKRWKDVRVGKGRLTLVGDPKQSIYRFRRADVGMYEQIRQQIGRGDRASLSPETGRRIFH